jgi:hypothetical protein
MTHTEEPVAISKISYVNVAPAALVRVLEARSALTISVLRISSIPAQQMNHEYAQIKKKD